MGGFNPAHMEGKNVKKLLACWILWRLKRNGVSVTSMELG